MRLADDLARKGYACQTVGIKLRYADFRAVTRDLTLDAAVADAAALRRAGHDRLQGMRPILLPALRPRYVPADEVRQLWQDWADLCDEKLTVARGANVVELHRVA